MRDELNGGSELLARISEVAGCTATTELWCSEAQKLLYDCRDEIEQLHRDAEVWDRATRSLAVKAQPLYCDEPGGSHGLDSR